MIGAVLAVAGAIVLWVEGPHADEARAEITKSLGADASVVDPKAWHDAFVRDNPAEASLSNLAKVKLRAAVLERVRRAAAAASVGEVVVVVTTRARGHHIADAWVVGKEGEPDVVTHVAFGEAGAPLGTVLRDKILASQPAVVVETKPVVPEVVATSVVQPVTMTTTTSPGPVHDAVAASTGRPHHAFGRELFDVSAGLEFGGRQFTNEAMATNSTLRNYWLGAAPLLLASAAVYPLADLRVPVLRDVGLVGGYAQVVGLSSQSASTGSVGTQWYRWYVGGRVRFHTGGPNAPLLGVGGAYGSEVFTFASPSDAGGTYPSATYGFVRVTGDVRVPVGPIALTASGGYLGVVTSGGTIPANASVSGVELGLSGAVEIGAGFEARIAGSYRRFFASTSVDEFMGLSATLAYVY